jgi:hypothetical protein
MVGMWRLLDGDQSRPDDNGNKGESANIHFVNLLPLQNLTLPHESLIIAHSQLGSGG